MRLIHSRLEIYHCAYAGNGTSFSGEEYSRGVAARAPFSCPRAARPEKKKKTEGGGGKYISVDRNSNRRARARAATLNAILIAFLSWHVPGSVHLGIYSRRALKTESNTRAAIGVDQKLKGLM